MRAEFLDETNCQRPNPIRECLITSSNSNSSSSPSSEGGEDGDGVDEEEVVEREREASSQETYSKSI